MIHAGVGQSADAATEKAVEQAFAEAFAGAGVSRADFAVVFFTVDHLRDPEGFGRAVRRAAGTDRVVGSSAAGVLTGAGEIEGRHGIAVLVVAADRIDAATVFFAPLRGADSAAAGEIAKAVSAAAGESSLTALFPDSYNGQAQQMLQALQNACGDFPVVGAGSSENGAAGATFQLCRDKVATNAVAGLRLSGRMQALIDITQGCQPITAPLVITRAEGNIIYEIDHRPAFEVFAATLKGPLLEDLRRALMYVFAGLPADRSRNSVGAGEYVVRNIIGVDSAKGLIGVAEEVRAGQAMIFALRDGQRAREDLEEMLQRQARRLASRKPAFGFYFNCCARGASLYGIPDIDSAYIRRALGDFPLIGMFGGYELAPLGGANRLFAYTGVLALISEAD